MLSEGLLNKNKRISILNPVQPWQVATNPVTMSLMAEVFDSTEIKSKLISFEERFKALKEFL